MTAPVVTDLPDAPQRADQPSTFIDKSDSWVADLQTWTDEVNALGTFVNDTAVDVDADATAAASSATSSENSATISASNANFKGNYSALTGALNVPASVFHVNKFWQLLVDLADVTASTPSTANSDWAEIPTFQPGFSYFMGIS